MYPRFMLAILIFAALSGCKKNSEINVAGTITIDDQPLPIADIRLIPIGNTSTHGGSARTDHNGRFTIVSAQGGQGMAAGEYKVVISKRKRADGSDTDPTAAANEPDARESLPPVWSDESLTTLTVTITREKRAYDFKLATPGDPKTYKKPR